MAYGYFRGGLTEAARDVAGRRSSDTADMERKSGRADVMAAQAENDIEAIIGTLTTARMANNEAGYRRTESAVMPVLSRNIALAMAARDGVTTKETMDTALQGTKELLLAIRGVPDAAAPDPANTRVPADEQRPSEPRAPIQESPESPVDVRMPPDEGQQSEPREPSRKSPEPHEEVGKPPRRYGPDLFRENVQKLRKRQKEEEPNFFQRLMPTPRSREEEERQRFKGGCCGKRG